MKSKLNLKNRILIGYSVPVLVFIIFGIVVYFTSVKINKVFTEVNDTRITLTHIYELSLRFSLMGRQVRGYLLVKNADNALQNYEVEKQRHLSNIENLKKRLPESEEKEKLNTIAQLSSQFDELAQKIFRLMDEGKTAEATDTYLKESRQIFLGLDRVNAELTQYKENKIAKQVEKTNRTLAELEFVSVLFPVVMLGVFIVTIYLINRNIEGMADQVENSSQELEGMLNQQVASTSQVVVAAKEIAANSKELSKTMEDVTAMSQSTTTAATDSQQYLDRMEGTMRNLASSTSSISNKLNTITEKADKINGIVSTITKVADQTNLLSLNASIEAEKAGEYGAGFSVVAREIRRLADQSAVATLDIEQMVKEMQAAVTTGVMEMDKFTNQMLTSVDDARKISSQMLEIIDKVQSLTPRFQRVSEGMEAQSEAAGQIGESMTYLYQAAGQTTSSLTQLKRVIEQLNSAAPSAKRI